MRSMTPMPGDPWPHDMIITVDDRPHALLELLWVREAHGLVPVDDALPPLLVDRPAEAERPVDAQTRERWAEVWPRIWDKAVAHAATEPDRTLFDRALDPTMGPDERETLLGQLVGPTARDEFGDDVFDDAAYREWERRGSDAHLATNRTTLADSPEHRDVATLADAWRRGLGKVVTLPCRGVYVRQIGPRALLVTDAVRNDAATYRTALESFRRSSSQRPSTA
ncbi:MULTISPECIES: hypothetical protein [unclassified Microbacterium]|uniref:hypothetical protein n=1 Tax=unclassified Microbacterium TaxID=2609290 RepID=UPI0021A29493|nr:MULTISPECIES: hypothetical protein [unclassified Microbacterium]MCT1365152.1 hypothetical protein [Microbacterium sp. p3-SID131]MCT1376100.1 hypothetical protein [Microbacterium sp. p3-SID337]